MRTFIAVCIAVAVLSFDASAQIFRSLKIEEGLNTTFTTNPATRAVIINSAAGSGSGTITNTTQMTNSSPLVGSGGVGIRATNASGFLSLIGGQASLGYVPQVGSSALTNIAAAGSTGTGALVYSNAPTMRDATVLGTLTASNLVINGNGDNGIDALRVTNTLTAGAIIGTGTNWFSGTSNTFTGSLWNGSTNIAAALAGKQASFTTGVGVTNESNVVRGNYTPGTSVTFTTNAYGAVAINSTATGGSLSADTNNILSVLASVAGSNTFWESGESVIIKDNFKSSLPDTRLQLLGGSGGYAAWAATGVSGQSGIIKIYAYPTNATSLGRIVLNQTAAPLLSRVILDGSMALNGIEKVQHTFGIQSSLASTSNSTDRLSWIADTNWNANWIAGCASNNNHTYWTSSLPVTIDQRIRLSIYSPDGLTASFYTNGVLATTITTNVPLGRSINFVQKVLQTATDGSATSQNAYLDWLWILFD